MARFVFAGLILLLVGAGAARADDEFRDVPGPNAVPKRVVYVCDASKSMKDAFPAFLPELLRAIEATKPEQAFTIVLLSDGKAVALDKTLLPGTPENKQKAVEFMRKAVPGGASNVIAGFRVAFAAKPEKIFFADGGGLTNANALIAELRTLNKGKRLIVVDTISVFTRTDASEKALEQVALENGGTYKFVKKADLATPDGK